MLLISGGFQVEQVAKKWRLGVHCVRACSFELKFKLHLFPARCEHIDSCWRNIEIKLLEGTQAARYPDSAGIHSSQVCRSAARLATESSGWRAHAETPRALLGKSANVVCNQLHTTNEGK